MALMNLISTINHTLDLEMARDSNVVVLEKTLVSKAEFQGYSRSAAEIWGQTLF